MLQGALQNLDTSLPVEELMKHMNYEMAVGTVIPGKGKYGGKTMGQVAVEKRIGTLIYDPSMGRFDIRFGIESYYGGLHCGECFDVKVKDAWIPVRIEMDEDWYLVGLPKTSLSGLTVRM